MRLALTLTLVAALTSCATTVEESYPVEVAAYKDGDYRTAELGWKARADRGDANAFALLGALYYNNMGYPQRGLAMMNYAARRGNKLAQRLLLRAGEPVPAADLRPREEPIILCQSQSYRALGQSQTICFPAQ